MNQFWQIKWKVILVIVSSWFLAGICCLSVLAYSKRGKIDLLMDGISYLGEDCFFRDQSRGILSIYRASSDDDATLRIGTNWLIHVVSIPPAKKDSAFSGLEYFGYRMNKLTLAFACSQIQYGDRETGIEIVTLLGNFDNITIGVWPKPDYTNTLRTAALYRSPPSGTVEYSSDNPAYEYEMLRNNHGHFPGGCRPW